MQQVAIAGPSALRATPCIKPSTPRRFRLVVRAAKEKQEVVTGVTFKPFEEVSVCSCVVLCGGRGSRWVAGAASSSTPPPPPLPRAGGARARLHGGDAQRRVAGLLRPLQDLPAQGGGSHQRADQHRVSFSLVGIHLLFRVYPQSVGRTVCGARAGNTSAAGGPGYLELPPGFPWPSCVPRFSPPPLSTLSLHFFPPFLLPSSQIQHLLRLPLHVLLL